MKLFRTLVRAKTSLCRVLPMLRDERVPGHLKWGAGAPLEVAWAPLVAQHREHAAQRGLSPDERAEKLHAASYPDAAAKLRASGREELEDEHPVPGDGLRDRYHDHRPDRDDPAHPLGDRPRIAGAAEQDRRPSGAG